MDKDKKLALILIAAFLVSAILYFQNKVSTIFVPRNRLPYISPTKPYQKKVFRYGSYPQAQLTLLSDTGAQKKVRIDYSDQTSNNPLITLYYAPVITSGHQDAWMILKQFRADRANGSATIDVDTSLSGKFWLMVNVNERLDKDRLSCTGNPTYTERELENINIKFCGPLSYLEVNFNNLRIEI